MLWIVSGLLALAVVALAALWLAYCRLAVDLCECDAERLRLQQCLLDRHREKQAA